MNVQFGCGLCAPPLWRNFDASPTLWVEKRFAPLKPLLIKRGFAPYPDNVEYGDIVQGLPLAPGSAHAVYCSHVLEHLALEECRAALRNVFTYLRPGGCFRFVLPDLEYMINKYCEDPSPSAAMRFIEATDMGERGGNRGLRSLPRQIFGLSKHRWMWDYKSLACELLRIGFVDVRRASFGDSVDPVFGEVETSDRWGANLGIDCTRPPSVISLPQGEISFARPQPVASSTEMSEDAARQAARLPRAS